MTAKLKEQIKSLPQKPGVYFLKNNDEEILYIGKAINIKKRVQTHFVNGHSFAKFYPQVASVDFIETPNEKSALILENQLIKKYQPKYNVDWKDDKNYSFVAFTREEFPRVFITHQPRSLDADVIGPFVSGYELKEFLFEIRKLVPYRTCKNKPLNPCLYYDLGLCWAHGKEVQKYYLVIRTLKTLLGLYAGSMDYSPRRSALSRRRSVPSLECYDISNTQGSLSVGSMVSFKGAKPDKSMYRKFKIRTVAGSDDPRSIREVLDRRLSHTEWDYPDLMLIDGGRSQLSKLKDIPVPLLTIAKLNREKLTATIFSPFSKAGVPLSAFPVEIARVFLAIRDEAHRFAITYHRLRRIKNIQ
jgi:excinuclease UvrABC nuclease subunit